MEVDPQEGPLALDRVRNRLNTAHVERNKRRGRVGDENSVALGIDVDLPRHEVLRVGVNRLKS